MKQYIGITLAAALLLLAGCDSDTSTSSECKADEVKADCSDGKYSKCINGKWTATECDDNASCNAENKCGECKDGDEKSDCSDGKYSKCVNGKWTATECNDNASCKADGTCGECKDGDTKDCENDDDGIGKITVCTNGQWSESKQACNVDGIQVSCSDDSKCGECASGDSKDCANDAETTIGKAILCKNGRWNEAAEKCPGQVSCSMTDDCYTCHQKCDQRWSDCYDACKETTCKAACESHADCKKECGICETKCGECTNAIQPIPYRTNHKNCKEDANGVGSADMCFNGKWQLQKDCRTISLEVIRSADFPVSCYVHCPDGSGYCEEEEKISECGQCQNTAKGKFLCIASDNNPYGDMFPYLEQLAKCENGIVMPPFDNASYKECQQGTCDPDTGACAATDN